MMTFLSHFFQLDVLVLGFKLRFSRKNYSIIFGLMVYFMYSLARWSSQTTLDSLDMTRYSEDGEKIIDDRIAVLEFELRKAKETINALRTNLTVVCGK